MTRQSDKLPVKKAVNQYESEEVCRFVGNRVVGGTEIRETTNPSARIFSTLTMDVEP